VFRKQTRGQVIGAELQEGLAHIGVAATEAGRLAAEQLGPRVAAAREAAGPRLDAAQKAVAPKVAAAVAAAAPAVASARESVDAARDALAPRVEAARDALAPRVEAAREAAAPRVAAAQAAAAKAAADLAPRLEAVQKTLKDDVVPRLEDAQRAAAAYAAPRVAAAKVAVAPALESARETLAAGVDSALSELDARRAEMAATAEKSGRKARKAAKKARKTAVKKRHEFEKKAAATAKQVRRGVGAQKKSRRWPWLLLALGVAAGVVVLLRGKKQDSWTPAPAGDGPVPSYREDPVPSSPSGSGKTVSDAEFASGDGTPADSDLGEQTAQMAEGDEDEATRRDVRGPGIDGDRA
jgi:hypothetical protein